MPRSGSFSSSSVVKNSPVNAGDMGLIPGLGRSPGEGNGNPLQYSCLRNPIGRGAWWAAVHAVAKSQTHLNNQTIMTMPRDKPRGEDGHLQTKKKLQKESTTLVTPQSQTSSL